MMPSARRCTKCGNQYPATSEYYHRHKRNRDGFATVCKSCSCEIKRRYYQDHAEKIKENVRRWGASNSEKVAEYKRKYAEQNPDKVRESARRCRRRPRKADPEYGRRYREINRDRILARKRQYYRENVEKHTESARRWRLANPEKRRAIARRYWHNHPGKRQANKARRRAIEYGAEGHFTPADVERQRKAQKGKCYYKSDQCRGKLTIEHLVALARGGTNWPDNIVLACEFHNSSKNDKLPHEYAEGGRLL